MPRCPRCGSDGGLLLLISTAPCGKCSAQLNNERARPHARPEPRTRRPRVRFVPFDSMAERPTAERYASFMRESRDGTLRKLNSGSSPSLWMWGRHELKVGLLGIADFGEDERGWLEVPDGMDWGQREP